jgi:hypothetical protein
MVLILFVNVDIESESNRRYRTIRNADRTWVEESNVLFPRHTMNRPPVEKLSIALPKANGLGQSKRKEQHHKSFLQEARMDFG